MDWKDVIEKIAPTLATGLFGPLGGIVASIAANILLPAGSPEQQNVTPQIIIDRISKMTDPADFQKLRQVEIDLQKFEADNKFHFAELEQKGIQNAREAHLAALASGNKTADQLSWVIIISFLLIAFVVLVGCGIVLKYGLSITSENGQMWVAVSGLVGAIVGYFSANAQQVVSFYFGSSSGSAAKSDQLAAAAQNAVAAIGRSGTAGPAAPPTAVRVQNADGVTTTVGTGQPAADEVAMGAAPAAATPRSSTSAAAVPVNVRWDACVSYVLEREGGYSNDPDDPGGPTNLGITQRDLAAWRRTDVTPEEVKALGRDEAKSIYRAKYWNVARCDALPAGVDLSVFDAAVMSGPAQGVRFLQRAAGLPEPDVDGVVGPQTLGAVARTPSDKLIDRIAEQRAAFYTAIVDKRPASAKFIKGWLGRTEATRDRARSMLRLYSS
ncbi:hypothetical protein J2848_005223 [Azospirillum lipoferum]|uniref:Uncharacterized protein n=1 Tax=Azospirillum lipoferum TaxID=193 RepID=A0A5A9GGY4_AZOLI|nr:MULTISPECIES: glycosyl hydrolase 108 family protein [Azospirillum]KAA0593125.1 hypothetical protein FZ942_24605 [Azospirillum lipoferum]MCP1613527.1 hypothetical protein [Azospirillum lipoferum]MDW5532296.1 glycosyl hydrolase 108 family protein [Azospirillum sp. NL1]